MLFSRFLPVCFLLVACGGDVAVDRGEEHLPLNDRCGQPLDIGSVSTPVELSDDTSRATDEHPELTCDSPNVASSFNQGQLYYRFQAVSGGRYRAVLKPSFYGFLYVFPEDAGCTFLAIETACSSQGAEGEVSPISNPGTWTALEIQAKASKPYVLAVDGDTSTGPFSLTVEEL